MSRNDSVQVMVRMRPSASPAKEIQSQAEGQVRINLGRPASTAGVDGGVNNQPCEWNFVFDAVLGGAGTNAGRSEAFLQEEAYDIAAKDVVENVLAGFNGTIMAYGQTGAGSAKCKTGHAMRKNASTPVAVTHLIRFGFSCCCCCCCCYLQEKPTQ